MAIQFECPHCSAVIRVPDDSGGKAGKCPQCQTQLLVPQIQVPPASQHDDAEVKTAVSPNSQIEPPTRTGSAGLSEPVTPTFDPPPPGLSIEQSANAPAFEPMLPMSQPTVARRYKRIRRRKSSGMLIPIMFGSILVGTTAFFYLQKTPKLEGELTADAVDFPDLAPALVDPQMAAASAEAVELVLNALADSPERFDTALVEMQFRGTTKGVEVTISPARHTAFFRVNIKRDAGLMDYYEEHGRELSDYQSAQLKTAATDFFETWAESIQESVPIDRDDMLKYRDRVGLNVLVNGMGFHVIAIVGKTSYRCVYEGDDYLYFMLPKDTTRFKLTGRGFNDVTVMFPGNYTVKVIKRKS